MDSEAPIKKSKTNTNSTVDDRLTRKKQSCSFCPPNKGENRKNVSKHGSKKPKYKNRR